MTITIHFAFIQFKSQERRIIIWITDALSKSESLYDIHFGVVTDIVEGMLNVSSHAMIANVRVVAPFGVSVLPQIGQEVLLAAKSDGEYICLGELCSRGDLADNETKITSQGGGYITFKGDGEVVINGLRISSAGAII